MAALPKQRGRIRDRRDSSIQQTPARDRSVQLAWALFLLVGVPLGFMAALGPLAYAGIYIEPLRQFWRPWPSDLVKALAGVAGFAATLAYLAHRIGKRSGFRWGKAAATAEARNVETGRVAAPANQSAKDAALARLDPPPRP